MTEKPAHHKPTEPTVAAPAPAKSPFIEVELLRKYCPHVIVSEAGEAVEQNNAGTLVTFPAGTVLKLPRDEAIRIMRHENRIARPSEQAFD